MPKFSIVLPTYNRAGLLPRAVGSVLDQTFTDWELLVVDDGSKDGTAELLQTYSDPRIRALRNAVNRERSYSRNRAIAEARGDFICFLDSDDEWLPDHLQVHATAWETADYDLAGMFSQTIYVRDGVPREESRPPLDVCSSNAEYVLLKEPPPTNFSFRAEIIRQFPFDERLHVNEDIVVFAKIAARHPIGHLPEATARYHLHGDNTHQQGRDTLTPRIRAMNLLFADPAVRRAIPAGVRRAHLRQIRHNLVAHAYRFGTRWQAFTAIASFLLRHPLQPRNQAKLILLLNRIPGIQTIPRVRRAAAAVIRAYY